MKTKMLVLALSSFAAHAQPVAPAVQRLCLAAVVESSNFKDPASARIDRSATWMPKVFTDARGVESNANHVTLIVNAKNSYGAYAGGVSYDCFLTLDNTRVLGVRSH